jgi:hypothetical protein
MMMMTMIPGSYFLHSLDLDWTHCSQLRLTVLLTGERKMLARDCCSDEVSCVCFVLSNFVSMFTRRVSFLVEERRLLSEAESRNVFSPDVLPLPRYPLRGATNILHSTPACIQMQPSQIQSMPHRSVAVTALYFLSLRYSIQCMPPNLMCIVFLESSVRGRSTPWRPKQSSQQPA